MIIIGNVQSNVLNNTVGNTQTNNGFREEPPMEEWKKRLIKLITEFIDEVPPKQLKKELRDFFMLQIAGLESIPHRLDERTMLMLSILTLMDDIEEEKCK